MNWMEALGLTLLHFVWQGLLIGGLAAVVNKNLKSAQARYLAACGAMALMGLSALVTFLCITQPGAQQLPALSSPGSMVVTSLASVSSAAAQPSWTRLLPWLDCLWFAGVFALAVRSSLSWLAAMRLSRTGIVAAPPEWQQRAANLMQRLAITRPVRLYESLLAEVPSVIGWIRPVILIPAGTLAGLSAEQLETILAHELAHIRRHDYLVNLLQTAIETLLFYHPAVWWVGSRMRLERENCCDDMAVAVCGDAFLYARALANLEHLRQTGPRLALAATDGGLLSRIARLLGRRTDQPESRSYWLPAILMITLAAVGLVAQQRTPQAPVPPPTRPERPSPFVDPPNAPAPPAAPGFAGTAPQAEVPEVPEAPEPPQAPPTGEDFIESMQRAGLKNLTVEQLVALKVHGVTPEYIQQTKSLGLNLNIDQLMAFRIHGVTPEFLNEWKARGWNLTPDQLVAFRIHGVTAASIDQMKALGFNLSPDEAVAMRIHGITPDFVKSWRAAGFADIKFDHILALRIHNAQPSIIPELKALGFPSPTVDEILQARIFDITPQFVQAVRKRGFENLTFEQVLQLKRMDIIR